MEEKRRGRPKVYQSDNERLRNWRMKQKQNGLPDKTESQRIVKRLLDCIEQGANKGETLAMQVQGKTPAETMQNLALKLRDGEIKE